MPYEALTARFDLYAKLQEGLDDVAAGRTSCSRMIRWGATMRPGPRMVQPFY